MEIVIGDDCSTDGTRAILRQFQDKYPEIILILPPEKNLGLPKNLKRCLDACTGSYIAICEGDDYWTDVYKLQKQKEYLELHQDFSMCFSALMLYFEDTNTFVPHITPNKDVLNTQDLIERNYIANFSCCMYRTSIVEKLPDGLFDIYIADWMFNIVCSQFGEIGFLRDWMSVWRNHSTGAYSGMSLQESWRQVYDLIDIYNRFLDYKYDSIFTKTKRIYENQILNFKTDPEPEAGIDIKKLMVQAQELNEIKYSRSWRFTQSVRQLRAWLVPLGSQREKLARVLVRFIRSLRSRKK
jgi:glycosyltransferase involved in cell wall biosynthesis